ncbi:uncharacterized protein J3D65DRAFT_105466 [Phyllosticta citribraziliensis]|uniref:Uncharacterized protein n=1 Tax=Phyllosticta citribraziliensis TaxID=989973 RepID=A0ABR1LB00_9PEZI
MDHDAAARPAGLPDAGLAVEASRREPCVVSFQRFVSLIFFFFFCVDCLNNERDVIGGISKKVGGLMARGQDEAKVLWRNFGKWGGSWRQSGSGQVEFLGRACLELAAMVHGAAGARRDSQRRSGRVGGTKGTAERQRWGTCRKMLETMHVHGKIQSSGQHDGGGEVIAESGLVWSGQGCCQARTGCKLAGMWD